MDTEFLTALLAMIAAHHAGTFDLDKEQSEALAVAAEIMDVRADSLFMHDLKQYIADESIRSFIQFLFKNLVERR